MYVLAEEKMARIEQKQNDWLEPALRAAESVGQKLESLILVHGAGFEPA